MKIKETFQLVTVAGEHMVIPIGEQSVDFQAMITLNETGAFLWKKLQEEAEEEKLVQELTAVYEVGKEKAEEDVKKFLTILKKENILEL